MAQKTAGNDFQHFRQLFVSHFAAVEHIPDTILIVCNEGEPPQHEISLLTTYTRKPDVKKHEKY